MNDIEKCIDIARKSGGNAFVAMHRMKKLLAEQPKRGEGIFICPPIVCLCGSTRFIDKMAIAAWEFEKAGEIVLSCHLFPKWYTKTGHHLAEEQGVADQLDELHLRKIDLADRVHILNVDGYTGESTRKEINYAIKKDKPITFSEEPD